MRITTAQVVDASQKFVNEVNTKGVTDRADALFQHMMRIYWARRTMKWPSKETTRGS